MPVIPYVTAQPQSVSGPQPRVGPDRSLEVVGRLLSEAGQVTASIYDAEQRAKAGEASALAAAELQRFSFQLDEDGDYDSHAEKYAQKRREVLAKYRGTIKSQRHQRAFDLDASMVADRFEFAIAKEVREKRIDAGRAAITVGLQNRSTLAAMNPTDREIHRTQAFADVDDAVSGGLLTAQEGVKAKEAFDGDVSAGELTGLIRTDPERAAAMLENPRGPYLGKMPEAERQQWLTASHNAIERQIAEEYAQAQRALALDNELRRRASDQAESELLTMLRPDELGYAPVEEISDRLGQMTTDAQLRWTKIANNGGRLEGGQLNKPLYGALSDAADAGVPIHDEAMDAWVSGQLGNERGVLDSLLNESERRRFKPARDWLNTVTKVRTVFGIPPSEEEIQREADAKIMFDSWVKSNPKATDTDALQKAKDIAGVLSETAGHTPLPKGTDPAVLRSEAISRALVRAGLPPGATLADAPPEVRASVQTDPLLAAELENIKRRESQVTP